MNTEITYPKVNIRELIGQAGFVVVKQPLPPFEEVEKYLHEYWYDKDNYPINKVGQPCYILKDTVSPFLIRAIYMGDKLTVDKYFDIIETLGTFTDDLLFNYVLDYLFGSEYDEGILDMSDEKIIKDEEKLRNGTCEDIYKYVTDNNIDIGDTITYLYALTTDDTSFFTELED